MGLNMKKCTGCGAVKDLLSFHRAKKSKDGHFAKCKECINEERRRYRKENQEKLKEYELSRAMLKHRVQARADYAKTSKGKEAIARSKLAYLSRNPIKKGASTMVGNAVRDGKLIKPTACSNCESFSEMIHGHHDDYAKPLVVRWLCPPCHKSCHEKNGEGLNGS